MMVSKTHLVNPKFSSQQLFVKAKEAVTEELRGMKGKPLTAKEKEDVEKLAQVLVYGVLHDSKQMNSQ